MKILGVDVGGSGIKGAIVETTTGDLLTERLRLVTPSPSTPESVAKTIAELTKTLNYSGPIGVGFPSVIHHGVAMTAANIHRSWIQTNARDLFSQVTGQPVTVLNDADAAGLAEMTFGHGAGQKGTVLILTVGTGIGAVLFVNGQIVPNLELGHIYLKNGVTGEKYASDATRKNKDLSWAAWASRFNVYLAQMEALLWPDLIIVGGGISKKEDKFFKHLHTRAPLLLAKLQNQAGIIGAALAAERKLSF